MNKCTHCWIIHLELLLSCMHSLVSMLQISYSIFTKFEDQIQEKKFPGSDIYINTLKGPVPSILIRIISTALKNSCSIYVFFHIFAIYSCCMGNRFSLRKFLVPYDMPNTWRLMFLILDMSYPWLFLNDGMPGYVFRQLPRKFPNYANRKKIQAELIFT